MEHAFSLKIVPVAELTDNLRGDDPAGRLAWVKSAKASRSY